MNIAEDIYNTFEIDKQFLPAEANAEDVFAYIKKILSFRIEELLQKDAEKLLWILYRIDVDEKKVRTALEQNPSLNYADALADLIIERQIQKYETRKKFSENETEDWSFDV